MVLWLNIFFCPPPFFRHKAEVCLGGGFISVVISQHLVVSFETWSILGVWLDLNTYLKMFLVRFFDWRDSNFCLSSVGFQIQNLICPLSFLTHTVFIFYYSFVILFLCVSTSKHLFLDRSFLSHFLRATTGKDVRMEMALKDTHSKFSLKQFFKIVFRLSIQNALFWNRTQIDLQNLLFKNVPQRSSRASSN